MWVSCRFGSKHIPRLQMLGTPVEGSELRCLKCEQEKLPNVNRLITDQLGRGLAHEKSKI